MYDSEALSTVTLFCNHHHNPFPVPFHLPQKETLCPLNSSFPSTPTQGSHYSAFCLCEYDCSRDLFKVEPSTTCSFASGFPGGSDSKECASKQETGVRIPGLARSPGEGKDRLLQYSCLENSTDRGAWWATVHGVAKSQTWLSDD